MNRIRVVPSQSIGSSGTRRLSPSGRWQGRPPALIRFANSPTNYTVLYTAGALRRTSCHVLGVQLEIRL
jgi:hypothetical protein